MKYYNHDADWQDRVDRKYPYWGPQSRRVYDQVVTLLTTAQVPPSGLAIDIGCGAGALGITLERVGYKYLGLDDSKVAVELGAKEFPKLDLRQHDMVKDPFVPEKPPQLVCSINALHCLVDVEHRQAFLKNLYQLCSEGAYLLLSTMCAPFLESMRPSKRPRAYLEAVEILNELREAGFQDFLHILHEPANAKNKVSNLMILAKG